MGSAPTNTKKRINYEECAAYIAAIGEVKAAFGEPDAKRRICPNMLPDIRGVRHSRVRYRALDG